MNYGVKKGFFNSPLIFMINCVQNEVNNTTLINENDNEILKSIHLLSVSFRV